VARPLRGPHPALPLPGDRPIFPRVNEFDAMGRAIQLAWRGWGRVAPNPLVGAVLLQGDTIIAEGYHAEFGDLHAELAALRVAGERARGATLVVTLEPCNHLGKQPPCAPALVSAGVRRVVAALADPNPEADGGLERLAEAGVAVELGLRADEVRAQNAIFLHRWRGLARPFVALKLATTLDGRIADPSGRSRWISGEAARDFVHWLRAGFDAIGVGGFTARTDDAALTVRGEVQPRKPPLRVVFDRMGELPQSLTLVRTARDLPTVLVTQALAPPHRLAQLEDAGVIVHRVKSLADGLGVLYRSGIGSILIEGGGRLAGALLASGLVDRYYWIQSPVWVGDEGVPAVSGLPGVSLVEAERWRVVDRRALGEDTLLVVDREAGCSPAS
jgi:diaminohydroxyphosphoribosylaminopyrimidine deaminase/5-amino-6-(5-phosphoribosylamino)uracil reductase